MFICLYEAKACSAFAFLILYYKMKLVYKNEIGLKGVSRALIQLIVSILLYFVIFFGIAFILNMLIRKTWVMAWLYPIVIIMVIAGLSPLEYITNAAESFSHVFSILTRLGVVDYVILLSGFAGVVVSGFVIKWLRKSGYRMF